MFLLSVFVFLLFSLFRNSFFQLKKHILLTFCSSFFVKPFFLSRFIIRLVLIFQSCSSEQEKLTFFVQENTSPSKNLFSEFLLFDFFNKKFLRSLFHFFFRNCAQKSDLFELLIKSFYLIFQFEKTFAPLKLLLQQQFGPDLIWWFSLRA